MPEETLADAVTRDSMPSPPVDRPRLRFKEQDLPRPPLDEVVPARFREPKPPTFPQRVAGWFRRWLGTLLVLAAVLAAALLLPFERWDADAQWTALHGTLDRLAANPGSIADLRQLYREAGGLGILSSRPDGAYPDQWTQRLRRNRYAAEYGVAQTLGFACLLHGDAAAGTELLRGLQKRTGGARVPGFVGVDAVLKSCDRCVDGFVSKPCPDCSGNGVCKQCAGQGRKTVAGLRGPGNRRTSIVLKPCSYCHGSRRCPTCKGVGHLTESCADCKQTGAKLNLELARRELPSAIAGARNAIARDRLARRVLRLAATPRRIFLGWQKSGGSPASAADHEPNAANSSL